MKKLFAALFLFSSFSLTAQNLFTYGKQSVSVTEFLRAYNKNNTGAKSEQSFRNYLDLYISSRLKIKEAKNTGLDTLPQMIADLANLRQQILPTYLNDNKGVQKLADEAFARSQKDIQLAHIFISLKQNTTDPVVAAKKKLAEVSAELKKGTSFFKVAQEYSDDPSAKMNGGNIGWVTVFTLPYELENLAYSTPAGATSAIYESKSGYHIFKNIEERKAWGRLKAATILLAFPPDADNAEKEKLKVLADSIYNGIKQGVDFGLAAAQFSNDVVSAASKGVMPEFGIGEYEPAFEKVVYGLQEGAISKPFVTSHGYHIVKLLSKVPVASDKNDAKTIQMLSARVQQSDRIISIRSELGKKVLQKYPVKEGKVSKSEIWAYSDSVILFKKPVVPLKINNSTVLFTIGSKKITGGEWIQYAQQNQYAVNGVRPNDAMLKNFINEKAQEYYSEHLEDFNEAFRQQINEFAEGNLFFEIMQRKVWTPAQADSAGLAKYFEKNKTKYKWAESADAIIFYATDASMGQEIIGHLNAEAKNWRTVVSQHSENVTADSARFELSQIPGFNKQNSGVGSIITNKNDNGVSFAYILKLHQQPSLRNFTEAKGMVINDFQTELENKWMIQLRKKYPVVINQKVLNNLIRNKKYL